MCNLILQVINQLTDGDGNLLLFGVSEDDTGHYQCNSSVGEVSVVLNVEGYSNSGQLGMCCYCLADIVTVLQTLLLFSRHCFHRYVRL